MFELIFCTKVFGKEVTDPALANLGLVGAALLFIGTWLAILSRGMIDDKLIRSEPNISSIFRRNIPPRRVLTPKGKRVLTSGYVLLGLGISILIFISIRNA